MPTAYLRTAVNQPHEWSILAVASKGIGGAWWPVGHAYPVARETQHEQPKVRIVQTSPSARPNVLPMRIAYVCDRPEFRLQCPFSGRQTMYRRLPS